MPFFVVALSDVCKSGGSNKLSLQDLYSSRTVFIAMQHFSFDDCTDENNKPSSDDSISVVMHTLGGGGVVYKEIKQFF